MQGWLGNEPPARFQRGAAALREVEEEGAALAGGAADPDKSTVAHQNVLHHVQSQPGAHACLFGGEESIKNMGQHLRLDAAAGIRHLHDHKIPRMQWMKLLRKLGGGNTVALHRKQTALFLHCLVRVGTQVQKDLVDKGYLVQKGKGNVYDFYEVPKNKVCKDGITAQEPSDASDDVSSKAADLSGRTAEDREINIDNVY